MCESCGRSNFRCIIWSRCLNEKCQDDGMRKIYLTVIGAICKTEGG